MTYLRGLPRRLARRARYELGAALGRPAGRVGYRPARTEPPVGPVYLEARVAADRVDPDAAIAWCADQSLRELQVVGRDRDGRRVWRVDRHGNVAGEGPEAPWVTPLGELWPRDAWWCEALVLNAAAEEVDAVCIPGPEAPPGQVPETLSELRAEPWATSTAFRRGVVGWDGWGGRRTPAGTLSLAKAIVGPPAFSAGPQERRFGRFRRGWYLLDRDPGPDLAIGVRSLRDWPRQVATSGRRPLVVTTSFLAHGGAEHTLFETLANLASEVTATIVTLAPHRPERGDRREVFAAVAPRILSFGDWFHPDAMVEALAATVRATGAEVLYNANGTTLFYEMLPRLRAELPGLRVVDHLYDHRVGYVERYRDPALKDLVDVCVAENRPIAALLSAELGWSEDRVPVVWPCGRRRAELPPERAWAEIRARVRRELGIGADVTLLLTAARTVPQKRPLDLVRLADRFRGREDVAFVLVGGGDLEAEVDAAIAAAPGAPVRRHPFRDDVPELIVAADAGCLVSEFEGLPVFMMECLQLGTPFVGTDVGEMGELLRATGAGLVSGPPGDLEAQVAAVEEMLDPARRASLARAALRVGPRFDPAACAARYREVLFPGGSDGGQRK